MNANTKAVEKKKAALNKKANAAMRRKRAIASFLLQAAEDHANGVGKRPLTKACRPYLRGFFGKKVPSNREVLEVSQCSMLYLLEWNGEEPV